MSKRLCHTDYCKTCKADFRLDVRNQWFISDIKIARSAIAVCLEGRSLVGSDNMDRAQATEKAIALKNFQSGPGRA